VLVGLLPAGQLRSFVVVQYAVPDWQARSPTACPCPPWLCRHRPVDTLVKRFFVVDDVLQSVALTVQEVVNTDDFPPARHKPVFLFLNLPGV